MKIWNRGSGYSLAFALLVASWCAAWIWFLLGLTRRLPGIYSFKSDLGALELLELPFGRPYSTVPVAIFLLCLMPPLLLSALRSWWDSKGRALGADVVAIAFCQVLVALPVVVARGSRAQPSIP